MYGNPRSYAEMRFFLNNSNTRWITIGLEPKIGDEVNALKLDIIFFANGTKQNPFFIGSLEDFNDLLTALKADQEIYTRYSSEFGWSDNNVLVGQPKFIICKEKIYQSDSTYFKVSKKAGGGAISLGIPSLWGLFNFENDLFTTVLRRFQLMQTKILSNYEMAIAEMRKTSTTVCVKDDLLALLNNRDNFSNDIIIQTVAYFFNIFKCCFYIM